MHQNKQASACVVISGRAGYNSDINGYYTRHSVWDGRYACLARRLGVLPSATLLTCSLLPFYSPCYNDPYTSKFLRWSAERSRWEVVSDLGALWS